MKKVWIVFLAVSLIIVVLVLGYVEYWQPDGVYEGEWEGSLDMDGSPVRQIRLELDEQSSKYGHMGIFMEDIQVYLPIHFDKEGLWIDESAGEGTFQLVETDGIYQLIGSFDHVNDVPLIKGKMDVVKIFD